MNIPDFPFARTDYPLGPCTWYHVGGPARVALLPRTRQEMQDAYAWMLTQDAPRLILGGGSNMLISDAGFPGIALISTEFRQIEALGDDRYSLTSGNSLDEMVQQIMVANNYAGVGALTGIPGTIGGAMFMNAGTANGSTCALLESAEVLTPSGLSVIPVTPGSHSYRRQSFCAPGEVILGGVFRFEKSNEDQRAVFDHYMQRRRERQPKGYCCGSVFKNPEGGHAGQLIEACGLKGMRHGGAVISDMHANFIMNDADASFDDIMELIALAKDRVREQFGVTLQEEVRIIQG